MRIGIAALAACVALGAPALAEPPAAALFGRIPAISDVTISPDGQHVALLGGGPKGRTVSIATIDKPGLPTLELGVVEGLGLSWVGDDHVIVRLASWKAWTPQLSYRLERNVVIDVQARPVSTLLHSDPNSMWLVEQPVLGVTDDPERVFMIGLTVSNGASSDIGTHLHQKSADHPYLTTLFSVDPATGNGKPVEVGGYDTVAWQVDEHGAPQIRFDSDEVRRRFIVLRRPSGGGRYVPLLSVDFEDRLNYYGYASAENAVYLLQNNQLLRMNLASGAKEPVGPTLEHVQPKLIWDTRGQRVVGIATGVDKVQVQWLDPKLATPYATLARAFPGRRVDLMDWTADAARLVARVTSADAPPAWYLYDRTRRELSPLGEEYPELKGVHLGTTRWIGFKARDGLEMGAYLTLPPDAATGAKLPLVVLPHGGPTTRDDENFDFVAQYLATRGYAVLRPQFRGSWGFGQAFEDAGRGEWGGKMQTDLLDAVAAAAAVGDVDPKRACIVGWSFGGYAAMAGAAFHSDSYRCAASFGGISDLGQLITEQLRTYGRDSRTIDGLRGDLGRASLAQLDAASPAKHANSVAIPLLLMHADQDTIVPMEQSTLMARAMTRAGKPVDLAVIHADNHYLVQAQTRTEMLTRLGGFLAKNLPTTP
jgi:dienelactone hydrolase